MLEGIRRCQPSATGIEVRIRWVRTSWVLLAGAVLALGLQGCGGGEPAAEGAPPVLRRLTQEQYRHVIRDTFGADISFGGRLDPDLRLDGLVALGSGAATITPVGFEQYDALARSIAAQVMEPRRRAQLFDCDPRPGDALDRDCARSILRRAGEALFRRPLTDAQLDRYLQVSLQAADRLADPVQGLQYGLATILAAPGFLFQKDRLEPVPGGAPGQWRLDAYSKAARLSFFLWDSGPDPKLLAAAAAGELDNRAGLERQVDRMLASAHLEQGARAFFRDFLQLANLEAVSKDSVIYPKFSPSLAQDAQEQTLRTVTAHLIDRDGDYRDLFTSRDTFMTRALGVVYRVPVEAGEAWTPFRFAADDPRAGLLSQISFTAQYALPGRSSPTLRGKAIREVLMCQTMPLPPANVNFAKFEAASAAGQNTARDRLTAHATDATCAGCHKIIDPIGLALERFDGLGALRDREGGAAIDASGTLDGARFADAAGLGKALHDHPDVASCLVRRLTAYGATRLPGAGETAWVDFLVGAFARDGYRLKPLLRRIALSDNFYRVAPDARGIP